MEHNKLDQVGETTSNPREEIQIPDSITNIFDGNTIYYFGLFLALWLYKQFLESWVKYIFIKVSYSKKDEDLLEIALGQILSQTGADRALLLERHNGDVTATGRHLHKLTCTKEITDNGIIPIAHHYQSIPMSLMSNQLETINEEKVVRTKTVVIDPNSYIYSRLVDFGVDFVITICLKRQGIMIAVLVLHYCRNQEDKFMEFEEIIINKQIAKINNILNTASNRKIDMLFKNIFGR